MRKIIILILLSFLINGCGYQFIGREPISQTDARSIVIPLFYNNTFEPLLEKKATDIFKQEFIKKGRWKIVNKQVHGDLILKGKITSFGISAISLVNLTSPAENRVTIQIDISVEDSREKKMVFEKKGITGKAEYLTSADTSANRAAQDRAILEAIFKSAEDFLSEMEEMKY